MDGELQYRTSEHVPVSNFREVLVPLCDELEQRALALPVIGGKQPSRKIVSKSTSPIEGGHRLVAYESRPKSMIDPDETSWHHIVRIKEVMEDGSTSEHLYDWMRHTDQGSISFFKYFNSLQDRESYFNFWHDFEDEGFGDDEIDAANLQRLTSVMLDTREELERQKQERQHEAVVGVARRMVVTASTIEALKSQLTGIFRDDKLAVEGAAYLASLNETELQALRFEARGEQLNARVLGVPTDRVLDSLMEAARPLDQDVSLGSGSDK